MEVSKNYSIVCYLERLSQDKVRAIQKKLFELTGSRKCLDAWTPHITVGSGIVVPQERQQETDEAFRKIADQQSTFNLTLSGFGGTTEWKGARKGITTPYVLWVNPVVNEPLMKLFNTIVDKVTSKYDTFYTRIAEYIPHVTVAYGD
ncbi:MAG: 2'-5' RNA ligase family protein, partial [Patescibacteria group bacterium]